MTAPRKEMRTMPPITAPAIVPEEIFFVVGTPSPEFVAADAPADPEDFDAPLGRLALSRLLVAGLEKLINSSFMV